MNKQNHFSVSAAEMHLVLLHTYWCIKATITVSYKILLIEEYTIIQSIFCDLHSFCH